MKRTERVRKEPVHVQVAARIRDSILSGRFPPGEELPAERELAFSFGASRASVREALRALQAEGLVLAGGTAPLRTVVTETMDRPARDALVNILRLKQVSLADLIDLRIVLEPASTRKAAERHDTPRLAEAEQALAEMGRDDISAIEYDELDVRFHLALVRASGNEAMHLMMLALRDSVADHLLAALLNEPDPNATFRALTAEHRAIFEAVERGEGDRAATLVETHIRAFYP